MAGAVIEDISFLRRCNEAMPLKRVSPILPRLMGCGVDVIEAIRMRM